MKLRTSYFNGTVLRKDITRFAPLWVLYTVFTLMVVFLLGQSYDSAAQFANSARGILQSMGVVNFGYGSLCAILLFGDLFTPRMCNALHGFPMRREGWFATHCSAGLLFCLVPNILGAAAVALCLEQYWWLALIWLAVMVLQFLFFFGAGVFSVMCAGNRLGAAAVYGIFNFLSVIAVWIAMTFYGPFLYGINSNLTKYTYYSPVVGFSENKYILSDYGKMEGFVFQGFLGDDWRYLLIAAAVGLVLLVLALLIYRARKLESAGDFISLRPVGPVFLIIYTLCVGTVMYDVAAVLAEETRYLFLLLGLIIGFFTGRMLLERKVNVFRIRNFLHCAILMATVALSMCLVWLDVFGVVRYVPQVRKVVSVEVSADYYSSYYEPPYHLYGYEYAPDYTVLQPPRITEPDQVEKILQVHEALLADRDETSWPGCQMYLTYTLEDGHRVERNYWVRADSMQGQWLRSYLSNWQQIFRWEDWDEYKQRVNNVYAEYVRNEQGGKNLSFARDDAGVTWAERSDVKVNGTGYMMGLMDAIKADCDAGNMCQVWGLRAGDMDMTDVVYRLSVTWQTVPNEEAPYLLATCARLDVDVYDNCVNTMKYLENLRKEGMLKKDLQINWEEDGAAQA